MHDIPQIRMVIPRIAITPRISLEYLRYNEQNLSDIRGA
jgi:hypothetical protein